MANNSGVVRKSNVFVFIMDTILAGTILPIDLIINYEGALDIDFHRRWVGRHASRSTSGVRVAGNVRRSTVVTTNVS